MRLDALCLIIESVTGADPLKDCRKHAVISARVILANMLLREGMTETEVGDVIGWHHSTIHHYKTILRDALNYNTDHQLINNWNKVNTIWK